jgi:hypothetical protein
MPLRPIETTNAIIAMQVARSYGNLFPDREFENLSVDDKHTFTLIA